MSARKSRALKKALAEVAKMKKLWHDAERRASQAEIKAELWDKIVDAVREAVMPDIEEKVSNEVEDAVSGLSIS